MGKMKCLDLKMNDPQFIAEYKLLDFTEYICKTGGQPQGIYAAWLWILEYAVDKLIYRKAKGE